MVTQFKLHRAIAVIMMTASLAMANDGYFAQFTSNYPTAPTAVQSCSVCHTSPPTLNPYGNDYLNASYDLAAIEGLDSDGDGFANLVEINAGTFPGNPASAPTAPAAPGVPTGLAASDGTFPDRVGLTWNAVTGATSYVVYRGATNDPNAASIIGTATATAFDDSTAVGGTTYSYFVQAVNSAGSSALSASDPGFRQAGNSDVKALITSPAAGSTLAGSTVTIQWTAGTNATEYWLDVGAPGDYKKYSSGSVGTALSMQLTNLPTDGSAVQVWLYSKIGGVWSFQNMHYVTYTGATTTQPTGYAQLTSPAPGSALAGTTVTFAWSAGTGVTEYWLDVGAPGDYKKYATGSAGTAQSKQVSNLPTDGSLVQVWLYSKIGGAWTLQNMHFATYWATNVAVTLDHALISNPAPASTLPGSSVTFQWNAGTNVTEYWLDVGTEADYKKYATGSVGTSLSKQVTNLPSDGSPVLAWLYSKIGGAWSFQQMHFVKYTAAQVGQKALITAPAPGTELPSSTVTFEWKAGANATEYWLDVGSPSDYKAYATGSVGNALSKEVTTIPSDGSEVQVRLYSKIGGAWSLANLHMITYTAPIP